MIAADDERAYLDRLGLEREPPSVDALFRLHRAQVEHVPYETTWIHLGERCGVDRTASLRRIAHRQRGGYCFQLNGALSLLLESLGYQVSLHIGGVHGPDGPAAANMTNHLVLLVGDLPSDGNPTGNWYLDSGLGDALHEPLPLVAGSYQQGPFRFELTTSDSPVADWRFHHHPLGSFEGMAFRTEAADMNDFAARNEFLSTSPESGFVKTLTVQRRDADGVDILRGQVLQRIEGSVIDKGTMSSRREWFDALGDLFELPLTDLTRDQADALWERVHASHETWLDTAAGDEIVVS